MLTLTLRLQSLLVRELDGDGGGDITAEEVAKIMELNGFQP